MNINFMTIPINGSLSHHGVKGQKWGIRRYVDNNGHLTAEGKQKYVKYVDKYGNNKSFQKYYLRNLDKGYTQDEALIRAGRRVRNTNIALAGTALGAAGYMAYMYGRRSKYRNNDITIKPGQKMGSRYQIGTDKLNQNSRYFVNGDKHDNIMYNGWTSNRAKQQGKDSYRLDLIADKPLRIASEKTAKREFENYLNGHPEEPIKNYRAFNRGEAAFNTNSWKDFESHLKNKGYNGVLDSNDTHNAMGTKNAYIIFNNGSGVKVQKAVKQYSAKNTNVKKFNQVKRMYQIKANMNSLASYISAIAASRYIANRFEKGEEGTATELKINKPYTTYKKQMAKKRR